MLTDVVMDWQELLSEEKELQSPVSVLDFQFEEDESLLSFNLWPFNLEEWMSMDQNHDGSDEEKEVDNIEEKAMLLLNHVRSTSSMEDNIVEQLLFDFFVDELSTKIIQTRNNEVDGEMIVQARRWIDGEHSSSIDWEEYVRGMDKKFGKWNKFEEEQEEMAFEIEIGMLNLLVDEALADLLVR